MRGTCLANSNFHIRLTNRMCCATHVLINLDVFPLIFKVPWWQAQVVSTHRSPYLRPVASEPDTLCWPFSKQFYVPASAVTSYETSRLSSPNFSGFVVRSKTLTGFHTICYRLVLLRFLKEFQFSLNSDNNEHLSRNLQAFPCSSGASVVCSGKHNRSERKYQKCCYFLTEL